MTVEPSVRPPTSSASITISAGAAALIAANAVMDRTDAMDVTLESVDEAPTRDGVLAYRVVVETPGGQRYQVTVRPDGSHTLEAD